MAATNAVFFQRCGDLVILRDFVVNLVLMLVVCESRMDLRQRELRVVALDNTFRGKLVDSMRDHNIRNAHARSGNDGLPGAHRWIRGNQVDTVDCFHPPGFLPHWTARIALLYAWGATPQQTQILLTSRCEVRNIGIHAETTGTVR
jgi:hypothetical protein